MNGCDAGREGELIFRYIMDVAKTRKPVQRLWVSSMTKDAIREGFENLRPGEELRKPRSRGPLPLGGRLAGRDERHPCGDGEAAARSAASSRSGGCRPPRWR